MGAQIGTYVLRVAALLVADEFDMTTVADNEASGASVRGFEQTAAGKDNAQPKEVTCTSASERS